MHGRQLTGGQLGAAPEAVDAAQLTRSQQAVLAQGAAAHADDAPVREEAVVGICSSGWFL